MSTNKTVSMTGAALALAAAGLFAGLSPQAMAEEAQVHCYGINGCKGQNDCKTAKNACKGHGECKGQGWKTMSITDCKAAGGTVGA
ncbi:MAG: hypothetical protein KAX95_03150 [Pseudomonas sp.]|jgi:hypothetical protein|nr:hypothetical protein [Pseudomonas sp.]